MHVSKSAVSQHFGLAYKQQLIKAPFYGRNQGLTSRQWWQEVCGFTFETLYILFLGKQDSYTLFSSYTLHLSVLVLAEKVVLSRALSWGLLLCLISKTPPYFKIDLDPVFDKLFDALYTRFMTSEGYAVFPDVVSTLAEIKRHGYITGIISNSDERLCKEPTWSLVHFEKKH